MVENARLFFSKFVDYYFNHAPLRQSFVSTIHHSTFVHQSALIESSVVIGANCYISSGVVIKSGTRIHDNVKIGENSVVGKDGFGFVIQEDSVPKRFRHIGGVSINSGVEIGALTCIDRGTLSDTYIGENTKIDNLVHIAHNVKIGSESLIMASVTLCGSAVIGSRCRLAPHTVVRENIVIGDDSMTGLGAVVVKNVKSNELVMGVPAKHVRNI